MNTRRKFLKETCTLCMGTAFLGITASSLTSCASLPIYKTNLSKPVALVPVSSFAETNLLIVRDMQVPFDILLVKKSETEYKAIYMRCSHQENPVTATPTGLYCSAHGSAFDLDGRVTKEPALAPLSTFPTEIIDHHVSINLK